MTRGRSFRSLQSGSSWLHGFYASPVIEEHGRLQKEMFSCLDKVLICVMMLILTWLIHSLVHHISKSEFRSIGRIELYLIYVCRKLRRHHRECVKKCAEPKKESIFPHCFKSYFCCFSKIMSNSLVTFLLVARLFCSPLSSRIYAL